MYQFEILQILLFMFKLIAGFFHLAFFAITSVKNSYHPFERE